jgi:hypothetical protein
LLRQDFRPVDAGGTVTRSIIRAAEWTLGPETTEGTSRGIIYSAQCVMCGAQAEPVEDERLPVEVWVLKHTGLNPTHRQYKATAETFWRVTPAKGNPYRELDAQGTTQGAQRSP